MQPTFHLTYRSYVKIPHYTIYTTNHPDGTAHGGIAVIVKNTIKLHELEKYRTNHIQATTIEVQGWSSPLTLSALYCPPRHFITKEQYARYYNTLGNKFIAAGDYNAKNTVSGSRLTTTKGRVLLKVLEMNKLGCQLIGPLIEIKSQI